MYSSQAIYKHYPGFCPERKAEDKNRFEVFLHDYPGYLFKKIAARPTSFDKIISKTAFHSEKFCKLDEEAFIDETSRLKAEMRSKGVTIERVAQVFALVREQAGRKLGMRHHDVQLVGGWVLFNGMVAEMETGEGKTLTATLPACAAALAGMPVHIITVNDYLAGRDASWMKPLYEAMGLSVGIIKQGMDPIQRKRAYACDVVYCTNKEIVFDYLRDHLAMPKGLGHVSYSLQPLFQSKNKLGNLSQRGLYFGIVDEADSVLVDEARTPLIISGQGNTDFENQTYQQALEFARQLEQGRDFILKDTERTLDLTDKGCQRLENLAKEIGGIWTGKQRREYLVVQALSALHLFRKDKDYLVLDGKVQIVDEYTGRIMEDRSWEKGLHQLIESKEGCEITSRRETLARISYQRFFRRYHLLSGMTGTAKEISRELWSVYKLHVVRVAPHKPLVRKGSDTQVFAHEKEKMNEILKKVRDIHESGRPVLIGTPTVDVSEKISSLLNAAGMWHRVLNARQDKEEAEIISLAGEKGQITVATNMAGRGTDIKLGQGVKEIGGLHVIATELHSARRIDRQLFGRCGRQGDPGSFEGYVSIDDGILNSYASSLIGSIYSYLAGRNTKTYTFLCRLFVGFAQRRLEKKHFVMRRHLLKLDESMESALAFSGRGE